MHSYTTRRVPHFDCGHYNPRARSVVSSPDLVLLLLVCRTLSAQLLVHRIAFSLSSRPAASIPPQLCSSSTSNGPPHTRQYSNCNSSTFQSSRTPPATCKVDADRLRRPRTSSALASAGHPLVVQPFRDVYWRARASGRI